MKKSLILSVLTFILLCVPVVAQDADSYESMRDKLIAGEKGVDYVKFYRAYVDWVSDRCNTTRTKNWDKMVKAQKDKKWEKFANLANEELKLQYGNRNLHFALAKAYEELKNPEKKSEHEAIGKKLLDAFYSSGDGKTPQTAYKVLSIREEYIIMAKLGYKVSMQALIRDKKYGTFDMLTGKNEKGEEKSFYFDINSFFGKMFSEPKCGK